MIVVISGKEIDIKYDLSKPEGDKARSADYSKAKQILDWQPKVELKNGLTRLYEWISKQIIHQ
jgi:nucleoside-diphosphate-sugar epimerase